MKKIPQSRKKRYAALGTEVSLDAPPVRALLKRKFVHVPLRIEHSPVHGYGLFAVEAIPRETKIIEYTGKRVRLEKALLAGPHGDRYMASVNRRWVIDGGRGGSGAQFINHSCQPNLVPRRIGGRIFFFSRRKIRAGEELTFRYGYPSNLRRVNCHCGATRCRGYLRLFFE